MNDHERALAEYIVECAKEYGELDIHVSDEIDWDINDLEISTLDEVTEEGDPAFRVGLEGTGQEWYQTTPARYNPPGKAHPAEHDYNEIPILGTLWFRPTRAFSTNELYGIIERG